jgi:tetratricopeptide (TPR) repeat protein
MSLRSSLLIATALIGSAGTALAQTAPLNLNVAPRPAATREQPAAAPFAPAASSAAAVPAGPPRAEPGFKPVRPQPQQQAQPGARPATATARPGAPAARPVDESALRYYASQSDTARVAAEIRRLKTLHPNWQPPENLFAHGTTQLDERQLWDLYAAGRYDEVAEQIQALQNEYPDYVPSPDLTTKLGAAERRQRFIAASDQKDWEQVVSLAGANQNLLVCREIDILWRVAEAFASLEDKEQAFEVYRYVLSNCEDARERLATVQKASVTLPGDYLDRLIAAGKRLKSGGAEFESVKIDLVRRDIGALASGQPARTPTDQEIKLIETSARTKRNAGDAALLGWYAYQAKDYAKARDWFKIGYDASKDIKLLEGQILALRNMGQIDQAQALAYDSRQVGPLIRKAYIEIVATELTRPDGPPLGAAEMQRAEEVIVAEKSPVGAQALGWHLFNRKDYRPARAWFEKSTAWGETPESVLGAALSLERLGEKKEYTSFLAQYKDKYDAIAKLHSVSAIKVTRVRGGRGGGASPVVKQSVALYEAGRFKEAADLLDRNQGKLDPGMNALRGWAHYKANNFDESEKIFKKYGHVKGSEQGEFLSYIAGKSIASRWY